MSMDQATKDLIVDALRFFVWAGGEGIFTVEPGIPDPEETILNYAYATSDEDVAGYPEKVATLLEAAGIPVKEA